MYATHTIHKNLNPLYPDPGYTSIGDPYKDPDRVLPGRWREKQFQTNRIPKNAHDGFFIKLEHPKNEPYVELAEPYAKTQPADKRKLGFGTKDANKRGEFTSTRATERYRDLLVMEQQLMDKARDKGKEQELVAKWDKQPRYPATNKAGQPLKEANHLYDIGRTLVTPYNPYGLKDTYYTLPKHAPIDPKNKGKDPIRRLGPYKPMSADIGELAWGAEYKKPEHGQAHYVDKFYDKGHLEVKGA
ncbi:hypothetical protein TrLO_g14230 [Triparma laevis f. longispina]|uniref:Uncharacterized protein n=1 Tax=Triparma laevis f. longispina TaxID=1714387 RepID=A0A9W7C4C7_9STRA|nr:hypothetical protein TrLO_g14230 [Triparma laevis f. longispina]